MAEILDGASSGWARNEEPSRQKTKDTAGNSKSTQATSTALEAMREVIQEFFARLPKGKCANCGASSPTVKKQGHTRLFKVWTTQKAIVQNQLKGIQIKNVLDQPDIEKEVAALEDEMMKELHDKKKKALDRMKKSGREEEEDEEEEKDKKPKSFLDHSSKKENEEFEEELERDFEEAEKAEGGKAKAADPDAA